MVAGAIWLAVAAVAMAVIGAAAAAAEAAIAQLPASDIEDAARGRGWAMATVAADPGRAAVASSFARLLAQAWSAVLITVSLSLLLPSAGWLLLCAGIAAALIAVILVGVSPRTLGGRRPLPVLVATAPVVAVARVTFGRLAVSVRQIRRRSETEPEGEDDNLLLNLVDKAAEQSRLESDERELIHSVFEFRLTLTRSIMVPRTDMATLPFDTDVSGALDAFFATGFSRLPVEGEDVDDIRGVLYLRDTARAVRTSGPHAPIAPVVRPASFVPESKPVDDLLHEMQRDHIHMGIVIDEYGGVAGLVTLEDVLEELVGEISDEYDHDLPEMQDLGNGRIRVNARASAEDVGEAFGVDIMEDDVDSVGGLFVKHLGALPSPLSKVRVGPLVMVADRVDPRSRRLVTLLVERVGPGPAPALPAGGRA